MQQQWIIHLKRGKLFLSRHDPRSAIQSLEKAIQECPVEESDDLSTILYLCGVAFQKLGDSSGARKCWYSAANLNPLGPASTMLKRDGHTMEKEWFEFKTVQLARYFAVKQTYGFFSEHEREQVLHIIETYWEEILATGILPAMDREERDCFYREVNIDFGYLVLESETPGGCSILSFENEGL